MTELTWLTVGGCARSGTSALGNALRQSRNIQLFHEFRTDLFFNCVEVLFAEERRHREFKGFPLYAHLIPMAERDAAPVVQGIFEAVFRERAPVVGTKLPFFYVLPRTTMPPGITEKVVMISRNPYDVVLSNVYKWQQEGIYETNRARAEIALLQWIRGWNHAATRHGDEDFFHIFYDDLDGTHNSRIARELAAFLGIEADFDLAGVKSRKTDDIAGRYAAAELQHLPAKIGLLFAYDDWPGLARHRLENGIPIGFPLEDGEAIDFTKAGNSWKYVEGGFYPPAPDGSWTMDGRSAVVFTPAKPMAGDLTCLLDIKRAFEYGDEAAVATIRINGQAMARQDFSLGERNGSGREFKIDIRGLEPTPGPIVLEICVENPRSPKAFGLNDDDRSLGLMIRKLTLDTA